MVCTVLTGIREMAMLENMWPPTWKRPMGTVSLSIARVGRRSLEKRTRGDMNSRQYPATKPNWMNVRVTGYLNWFMIDFPVLDESAEEVYQIAHRRMKRSVSGAGSARRPDVGSVILAMGERRPARGGWRDDGAEVRGRTSCEGRTFCSVLVKSATSPSLALAAIRDASFQLLPSSSRCFGALPCEGRTSLSLRVLASQSCPPLPPAPCIFSVELSEVVFFSL